MLRLLEELAHWRLLNRLARIHHDHAIGNPGDYT
jgi:hypothetical protein